MLERDFLEGEGEMLINSKPVPDIQIMTYYWNEVTLEDMQNWADNPNIDVQIDYREIHVIRSFKVV